MESVNVGGDYEKLLVGMEPRQYIDPGRPGTFAVNRPIVLPPLNTDIRFSAVLPEKHVTDAQYLTVATTPLPETWDWRHAYDIDDPIVKKRKTMLTEVTNQGLCGSCWAVAVAGLVSDLFVTTGLTDNNPDISATYSLSCFPQHKCGGGNPAELLKRIEYEGISTNKCLSYAWCNDDPMCSGSGAGHFDPTAETQRFNQIIPSCECVSGASDGTNTLYYVKESSVVSMENDNHDVAPLIKSHIFRIGSVIGGYHVLKNFMFGDFAATDGVYLEDYDYANDRWYMNHEEAEWNGSHAIVVVGWGVSAPINKPLPDGRPSEIAVPYWYCATRGAPTGAKIRGTSASPCTRTTNARSSSGSSSFSRRTCSRAGS